MSVYAFGPTHSLFFFFFFPCVLNRNAHLTQQSGSVASTCPGLTRRANTGLWRLSGPACWPRRIRRHRGQRRPCEAVSHDSLAQRIAFSAPRGRPKQSSSLEMKLGRPLVAVAGRRVGEEANKQGKENRTGKKKNKKKTER